MKAHHKKRLLRLADFLEGLKPKEFDIDSFVDRPGKDGRVGSCGTVACACGWAATIPEFRRAGLRINQTLVYGIYFITYKGMEDGLAAEEFFGLTYDEFSHLFTRKGYYIRNKVTPKRVAKRIRNFVAGKGVPLVHEE